MKLTFQKTYQVVCRKFKSAIDNLLQVSFIPLLKEPFRALYCSLSAAELIKNYIIAQ